MRLLKILIMIVAIPNISLAEDYKLLSANRAQLMLADADGQITGVGDIVQLWSITLRAPDQLLPKRVAIVKMLNQFNCASNEGRVKAMIMYRKNESLVRNDDLSNAPWSPIAPDTQISGLKEFACGSQSDRKRLRSIAPFSLGQFIATVYDGGWPVD